MATIQKLSYHLPPWENPAQGEKTIQKLWQLYKNYPIISPLEKILPKGKKLYTNYGNYTKTILSLLSLLGGNLGGHARLILLCLVVVVEIGAGGRCRALAKMSCPFCPLAFYMLSIKTFAKS